MNALVDLPWCVRWLLPVLGLWLGCGDLPSNARQSVLYGGGPLYTGAAANREQVRGSGFTTLVIWTIHVEPDGDLVLNDQKIIDNGVYVGRVDWPAEVAAFKSGPTSISRIEIGLSSHNDNSFLNIRDLVFAQGTGTNGSLYRNFHLLKQLIPAIDGINYDEESHIYDENVLYRMEQFSLMLADLGFNVELDVFCCSEAWVSVFNQVNGNRPGTIDRIDVQCYAGGGGNDPCWWNGQFGGLKVTPGLWSYPATDSGGYWSRTPDQVRAQMSDWNSSCNIAGGFMWYLDDMLKATNLYAVADYGNAINTALGIDPTRKIAAMLHEHTDYYGWSVEVGRGPYGALEISAAGGQIDQVSSLKVNPGWQVILFSEANFSGNFIVKTANDSTLVDDGWNDVAKSIAVLPSEAKPVRLYQHTQFWGWQADLEVGSYNSAQLIAAGGADNDASSVEITPGYAVTFYSLDHFLGSSLVKAAADASLVDDGWNDVVSSLKVSLDLSRWKPVTLHQDAAYAGWAAGFRVGAYTLNQILAAGGQNDDATSIQVTPGYAASLYQDNDFQGSTLVTSSNDICFYDDGFNDVLSSLIVRPPAHVVAPVSLMAAGAQWGYFAQTNDPGVAWRSRDYDDAAWPTGAARFGCGDQGEVTLLATNSRVTTYFRRWFYVPLPSLVSNLNARVTRDDAAVAYLNGIEIWRDANLPAGAISNQTLALSEIDSLNATNWMSLALPPATHDLLQPGWNLLAVEIHNHGPTDPDIGFDFELAAAAYLTPEPPLGVASSGGGLSLTWPEYHLGFQLHTTTNLATPNWQATPNTASLSNGAWVVQLPTPTRQQQYFRLQSQ